jgi:hypothetical protein
MSQSRTGTAWIIGYRENDGKIKEFRIVSKISEKEQITQILSRNHPLAEIVYCDRDTDIGENKKCE